MRQPRPATVDRTPPRPRRGGIWLDLPMALIGMVTIAAMATAPLTPREQAVFAIGTAVLFLVGNRVAGQRMTMFLIALSLAVSVRYMYWRLTETLQFASWTEMFFGTGLILAEFYAIVVLVLGYVQTAWPLDRKPLPLPPDPESWPRVDVYVPTYNEPMTIVRATVLAAMAMDYPRHKFTVYILDDGRRDEFRTFAEEVGCGYLTRADNKHAKAGNLNAAMKVTDGEFILVFDCDHIPTRSFLQFALGWLVAEPRTAMVQTPHHFYSPDPFQRNLAAGTRVPAEGNMFYGLVQNGNDFWNAAFFCGSCAIIRRVALNSIGGFATETVTEDAHTMLKLHRAGWESAYLKMPLAAGLATERLALHLGQRVRWARGMLQILRTDNPLFGPGLNWGQRICYLQATGHFLFAIPRVVFLTSPLAFLLLGQNVITASPLAITAYALPHIFHSVATNSRIQKNWRHSFWSEIYETVMALFLVRLTIVTLASPKRGKFNVTAKGGLLENGFFDLRAVYPNLIMSFLLLLGIGRGLVSMVAFHNDTLTFQALLLNSIWATFSLLVVMAALAVGRETRQVRSRARVAATLPFSLRLPDGRAFPGATIDLSQGGANALSDRPADLAEVGDVFVDLEVGGEPMSLPARVVRWEGQSVQLSWQPTTVMEEAEVVRVVFGRADAWLDWSNYPDDRPLASLWRVLVSIKGLFRPRDRAVLRPPGSGPTGGPAPSAGGARVGAATAALLLAMVAAGPVAAQTLHGAKSGTTVRVIPQATPTLTLAPPRLGALPPSQPAAQPSATSVTLAPGQPPAVIPPPTLADAANRPGSRRIVYTLRQLGASGPLALRGTSELQGVEFGIRADEVVTAAQLSLGGAMSPSLIPEYSNITVTLNEQYVGTIPTRPDAPNFQLDLPISPVFFQDDNRLNFRFTGRYTRECNDPLSGLLWGTVYDTSTLTLTVERLPPQRDLSRLPQPFFDSFQKDPLSLPFVLPSVAGNDTLRAAGIAASWFGELAAYRGANFPVMAEPPAEGNGVVVAVGGEGRALPGMPAINGPTLAMIANPNDPLASLLVIAGRTGEEAVAAAAALSIGTRTLGGASAQVQPPQMAAREPYDAPNWIPTNRPVRLGELVDIADLQSYGYVGAVKVPFRTAPDFYTWRDRPFDLRLRYRAPPGPVIDLLPSRLDVGINNIYLDTLSLAPASAQDNWLFRLLPFFATSQAAAAKVGVPVYDVFGSNELIFFFDARPLHRGECTAIPADMRMSVDPDSTLDLSGSHRFTELPNLAYFVNSGFPFTRMADLSETAVVMPDRPSGIEVGAFLDMMGRFGSLTGYPALKVSVVRGDEIASVGDRDLLVMGTLPHMGAAADLLTGSGMTVVNNRLSLAVSDPLESVRRIFDDRPGLERDRATALLSSGFADTTSLLLGAQSPRQTGRSVVAMLAMTPQALDGLVGTLRDSKLAPLIQGDLSVLSTSGVSSFRVTPPYTVGSLPPWLWPGWYLRDRPVTLVALMVAGCLLVGSALFWAMNRRAGRRLAASGPARGRPDVRH